MSKQSNEELIRLIKAGIDTQDNYEQLYNQNTGFINQVIRKRVHGIYEYDDLMQQAFIALVKAVEYHNPDLEETNFLTILKYCIWNETRGLAGGIPPHMKNKIYRYKKAYDKIYATLGRKPTDEEIALEMEIKLKDLETIKKAREIQYKLSLDEPIGEEGNITRMDLYADSTIDRDVDFDSKIHRQELRKILDEALNKLPDKNYEVLDKRYYKNMSLEQCSQDLNVSDSRVQQIEREGLRKLRRNSGLEKKLEGYISVYRHVGIQAFNRTHTSSVESVVLERERKIEQWIKERRKEEIERGEF